MTDNETPPVEPPKAPKRPRSAPRKPKDAPLTQEDFEAQMQRLSERAKEAGLSPLRTLVQSYAKQGMRMVESMMDALDTPDTAKKPAPKKRK